MLHRRGENQPAMRLRQRRIAKTLRRIALIVAMAPA